MVKNLSANAGNTRDVGLIPGSRRSSGEGNGNSLHYSCLEYPRHRGALWATVHGVTRESVMTEQLNNNNNNKNNNTGNFMKLLVYPKNACVPHSRIFCISYRDNCAQHFRGSCLPRKKSFSSLCARNSMFP